MLVRTWSNWDTPTVYCRWEFKWFNDFGNSLAVFHKVKHKLALEPINPTPRYLPKINGKFCLH